jgi:nitrite reductase/ring-hydroxylating ferredoxin subunit
MTDFIETVSLAEIPPGTSTTVTLGGKNIALFNVDGTVYATKDECLHAGASLGFGGKFEGKIVTCRAHGWKFDVTTGAMPLVPGLSLGCYPVKVEDGKVHVAI